MKLGMKKSKGFTLIEITLVMGIAMAISAVVWLAYGERRTQMRAEAHSEAVFTIVNDAEMVYASSMEFANEAADGSKIFANMDALMAAGTELPKVIGVRDGSTGYRNYWGGTWNVSTLSSHSAAEYQDIISITLSSVPQAECRYLLRYTAAKMYDTKVNGRRVPLEKDNETGKRNSINHAQALPLCDRASNTIAFEYFKTLDLWALRRVIHSNGPLTDEERGVTPPTDRYRENFMKHHNRVNNAISGREARQVALGFD